MQQNCDEDTKGRLVDELLAHVESMASLQFILRICPFLFHPLKHVSCMVSTEDKFF